MSRLIASRRAAARLFTQPRSTTNREHTMGVLGFLYGTASYAVFLAAFLYSVGFISNMIVPKSIDSVPGASPATAVAIDLILLGLFAVQHSVMARPAFKQWWTRIVPASIERSTYVLFSSLLLALLCWQWQAIPGTAWEVATEPGRTLLLALYWLGWLIVLCSTFMINHFDLFGLRQVYLRLKNEPYTPLPFVQFALYRFVRHPIMLGFLIAFWATPVMSMGHLLFACANTSYIFIGIWLEERDLRETLGAPYERYRQEAGMILPLLRRKEAEQFHRKPS
jgi:protein-S-isoprenylcysteine O-methyltransferase Ste14